MLQDARLAAVLGHRDAYPAIRRCRIGVATITVGDVERSERRVRKDATPGDAVSDLVACRSGKIVPSVPRDLFVCLPVLRHAACEVGRAVVTYGSRNASGSDSVAAPMGGGGPDTPVLPTTGRPPQLARTTTNRDRMQLRIFNGGSKCEAARSQYIAIWRYRRIRSGRHGHERSAAGTRLIMVAAPLHLDNIRYRRRRSAVVVAPVCICVEFCVARESSRGE